MGQFVSKRYGAKTDKATDYEDGKGLVYKMDIVDVSSNSYGSVDDGKFPSFIDNTKKKYFNMGLSKGRNGKGMVYIFPSGNGRHNNDVCGADGIVNQLGVIAISGVTYEGKPSYYAEKCSAVFAVTYSEGKGMELTSTDLNGECTTTFGGSSAAVPSAAGIIALVMEAAKRKGKALSYRDVMHIISMGAEVAPLAKNHKERASEESAWTKNGAGFWVSLDFGFGLLNAKNMVKLAEKWVSVPTMVDCQVEVDLNGQPSARAGRPMTVTFKVQNCQVKWLESVFLTVDLHGKYRGAFEVALTSPAGTMTYMMERRSNDKNPDMINWTFKSVHTWGENPEGTWKIQVFLAQIDGVPDQIVNAKSFQFAAYGMQGPPPHQAALPRSYAAFRLIDGRTSHD